MVFRHVLAVRPFRDFALSGIMIGSLYPVRTLIPNRLTFALLLAGMCAISFPRLMSAQDDPNDTPLGDVARSFRKKAASSDMVIDNDNFSKVVEDAESRRAAGSTMVFSLDPGASSFHVSTPDVSCSLSFSAKNSSLLADPILLDDLPRGELAKLEGPATIDGDSLQVSMHNGTSWELREVVIGLTIIRRSDEIDAGAYSGSAQILPAVASGFSRPIQDSFQKQPDLTVLLRVKGSAAPSATALFRTQLNFALFPDQEWHWAIVKAKGVPPQAPADVMTTQLEQGAASMLPSGPPVATDQALPSAVSSSNPDVAIH